MEGKQREKEEATVPSQVEPEVAQDASAGQEGAAHARHQLPVVQVASAVRMWHVIGLFDELAVHFITEGLQIVAGLQDALDDGYGVRHCLDFLKGVEDLHCFIL